jgi:multicomponent Na+:H+ antiporter subunit G
MPIIIDSLSWILLIAGSVFSIIGAIGVIRFPDLFSRMHAASVVDTGGAGLILLGLILQAGLTLVAFKLLLIGAFIFFTSPTGSHALARAALADGIEPLAERRDLRGDDPSKP